MALNTCITINLSETFNETGYINKYDDIKYNKNSIFNCDYNIGNHCNNCNHCDNCNNIAFLSDCDYDNCDDGNNTHIILTQNNNLPIKIDDEFLYYSNLFSIDTTELVNVTTIGTFFLCRCYNLRNFNTTGLSSLTAIEEGFLFECYRLTNINTIGLTSLLTIGDHFLYDCDKLTHFDTVGLTSLITIGNDFLYDCDNLINFDATGLTSSISIENNFMSGCKNLLNFNATGLTSLTSIGKYFLHNCDKKLTITIKNPPNCLREKLSETNYKIIQLYDKPIIHLDNNVVI